MATNVKSSAVVSLILSLLVFSGMQLFKAQLASSEGLTILGGFLGSLLFLFLLTAINNMESVFFDDYFQAKLFPEVLLSLLMSLAACGLVHRVSVTTCFAFSCIILYYMNKISATQYQAASTPIIKPKMKKRKH
uniref:Dolichyl-diphosphooligosaccharide--protein glycosyltransferase subunit KCP2 n=1 Tax=Phallusia mammillata TaxID=59560 RepID=A0A6F9DH01_9ASCI|nr:keratinocyte-associated protein 2-like [Phallusia mammillata]